MSGRGGGKIKGRNIEKHSEWEVARKRTQHSADVFSDGEWIYDTISEMAREEKLNGNKLVNSSDKSPWPSLNNTICTVDTKDTNQKRRQRLVSNRSCEGRLVGALLLDEEIQ